MAGCSQETNSTLALHAHDGVYDFIGHDGKTIRTLNSLDEFDSAVIGDGIRDLIVDNRVILRFEGLETVEGLGPTDEIKLIMGKFAIADVDVTQFDFEYTNQ